MNVMLTMGQPRPWITRGICDTSGLRKQIPEMEKAGRQDSGPQKDNFTTCGFCINIQGKMVLSKFRYVSEEMGGDNGISQVWLENSAEKNMEGGELSFMWQIH